MATEDRPGTGTVVSEGDPVLAPGHTLGTVTDKISALVLSRPYNYRWFLGFGVGFVGDGHDATDGRHPRRDPRPEEHPCHERYHQFQQAGRRLRQR